jgi:hypothetical protein
MAKKAVTIKPGETLILPLGVTIDSIITDGSIAVSSSCDNLPEPSNYKCGYFYIVIDDDDNDGHSMDETKSQYAELTVAGTTYNMGGVRVVESDNPGTPNTATTLNTFVPDQTIFSFTNVTMDTSPEKRSYVFVYFKVVETLWDEVELLLWNWETHTYYKPFAQTECGMYPYPE